MKKSTVFSVLALAITAIIVTACTPQKATEPTAETSTTSENQTISPTVSQPTIIEITATEDGQTALSLLSSLAQVQTKTYDFGTFIEGINGLQGNKDNYWALYVNGEYAKTGAEATVLKSGDVVKFVYEPVTTAPIMEDTPAPGAGLEL